jgi:lipoate-protein ligase A
VHRIESSFPGRPALDSAFSRALLERVAAGEAPETFRLYRPDDVLAFSSLDATCAGFDAAVAAARDAGFAPALRLAGGRAAVFHRDTLAFAWTLPAPAARDGIAARFAELADLVAAALRRLGVDARVGEVPGEYCPGEYSVNARGESKLMGVGQRVIRGAAHVGGVVVVDRSDRVREALEPVYAAMQLDWRPDTAGSVTDEIGATSLDAVAAELDAELEARFDVVPGGVPVEETLARAAELESRFAIGGANAPPASTRGKLAVER